jgi:hypothetical protein
VADLQTFSGEAGKRGEQSGIVTTFDIWCPVVERAILFPLPPHDKLEWAIAPIVFTALLPSIFGAFGLQKWPNLNATVTQWIGDDAAADSMGNYVQLSFLLAISGTIWLNETTEDIPVLVKMIVDAIGNVGAAVCIYQSASLPPK